MTHGIIVLGMARGGTTVSAEIVQRWGAYGGENPTALSQGDQWSPRGYWEYSPLRMFNREILQSVGASEYIPPDPINARLLQELAAVPEYRTRAKALLAGMQQSNQVWFWKDPLMCFVLPFWRQIWDDRSITYVMVVRNPIDTAISQQKIQARNKRTIPLDEFPFTAVFVYWQIAMCSVLENVHENTILIEYEKLVENPRENCERICRFLNQRTGVYRQIDTTIDSMVSVVTPELHRNASAIPFAQTSDNTLARHATSTQVALYIFLLEKVRNPRLKFDSAAFPLPDGWKSYMGRLA